MSSARSLTTGEIEMARTIFGDAVDYRQVHMIRRKWWFFQPKGIVMAPTGNMHFHPESENWSDDFAREGLGLQGLFMHEMTHIWQAQTRGRFYLPLMRHPFCRYAYEVRPGWHFDRYGLEQQAEIVRHAFLARKGAALAVAPPPDLLPFA